MSIEAYSLFEEIGVAVDKACVILEQVAEFFDPVPLKPEMILYSQQQIGIMYNVVFDYLHEINRIVGNADKLHKQERKEAEPGA